MGDIVVVANIVFVAVVSVVVVVIMIVAIIEIIVANKSYEFFLFNLNQRCIYKIALSSVYRHLLIVVLLVTIVVILCHQPFPLSLLLQHGIIFINHSIHIIIFYCLSSLLLCVWNGYA